MEPNRKLPWFWLMRIGLGSTVGILIGMVALLHLSDEPVDPYLIRILDAQEAVNTVAISPDATLVAAGSFYGTINMWRVRDGHVLHTWQPYPGQVDALTFTNENALLLSSGWDGTVIAWDVITGEQRYSLPPIAVSSSSSYSGSDDRERLYVEGILAIAIHSHTTLAAAGGWQGQLLLFHPYTGQLLHTWQGHPFPDETDYYESITNLTFHDTYAYLASGSSQGSVNIWDEQGDLHLSMEKVPATYVQSLRFAATDQELRAIFRYPTVARWSTQNGHIRFSRRIQTRDMPAAMLTHDRRFLIRGGPTHHQDFFKGFPIVGPKADPHIYIENMQTGATLVTLSGHTDAVRALALSKDDQVLASSGEDGTVRLWRVPKFDE